MAQAAIGRYTGNGINGRQITGVGFPPDAVLIMHENNGFGYITAHTKSMLSYGIASDGLAGAEKTLSLDSDGFTLGDTGAVYGVNVNTLGYNYIAFKDDAATEFSYGTFTGTGAVSRNIAMGFQPSLVMFFPYSGTKFLLTWMNSHEATSAYLGTTNGPIQGGWFVGPYAGGLTVNNYTNVLGRVYHWLAWKPKTDFFAQGSYTGNSTDNRNVTTPGWQGKVVNIESRQSISSIGGSGPSNWHHDSWSTGDSTLSWRGTSATFADRIQQKISTGFQLGASANVNFTNEKYDWYQFGLGDVAAAPVPAITLPSPPSGGAGGMLPFAPYQRYKTLRGLGQQLNNLVLGP